MAAFMRSLVANRRFYTDRAQLVCDLRHESGLTGWGLWLRLRHPRRTNNNGQPAYVAGVGFHARRHEIAFTGQDAVCRNDLLPLFMAVSHGTLEEAFPALQQPPQTTPMEVDESQPPVPDVDHAGYAPTTRDGRETVDGRRPSVLRLVSPAHSSAHPSAASALP